MPLEKDNEVIKFVGKTLDDFSVHMPFCFGTRDEDDATCSLVNLECEYAHACNAVIDRMAEDPSIEKKVFNRYRKAGQQEDYSVIDLTSEIERVKKMIVKRKAAKKKVEEPATDDFDDLDLDDLTPDTPEVTDDFDEPKTDTELGSSDVDDFDEPPVADEPEEEVEEESVEIEGLAELEEEPEKEPEPLKKHRGRPKGKKEEPKKAVRVLSDPDEEEIEEPEEEYEAPISTDERPIPKPTTVTTHVSTTPPAIAPGSLFIPAILIDAEGIEQQVKIRWMLDNVTDLPVSSPTKVKASEKPSSEEFITGFISDLGSGAEFTVEYFITSSTPKGFKFSEAGAKNVLSRYSTKHGGFTINKDGDDWTYVVG